MIIDFAPDGTVQAQHNDKFPLGFLGKQTIERASDIRFNEETQKWDMYVALSGEDNNGVFYLPIGGAGFDSYDEARKIEAQWLDLCRLVSVQPIGLEGTVLLMEIRQCQLS
jgi:hypothetical protein